MNITPVSTDDPKPTMRAPDLSRVAAEPNPWTAPDFVERSTCAEIGAYASQDA